MDRGGLTGLAVPFAHAAQDKVSSMNHDPCYQELPYLSITIIVLIFSELPTFVRKILQREENKGVELTVRLREGFVATDSGHPRLEGRTQTPHP